MALQHHVDIDITETPTSLDGRAALGDEFQDNITRNIYVLWRANGAITASDACVVTGDNFDAVPVTTALITDATGTQTSGVGMANATMADNDFGWFCIVKQDATDTSVGVNTGANAADFTRLNTTATAGRLDDDNAAGSFVIENLELTVDTGGAPAVNTTSRWNRPYITILNP